jgi:hypothetical protein
MFNLEVNSKEQKQTQLSSMFTSILFAVSILYLAWSVSLLKLQDLRIEKARIGFDPEKVEWLDTFGLSLYYGNPLIWEIELEESNLVNNLIIRRNLLCKRFWFLVFILMLVGILHKVFN